MFESIERPTAVVDRRRVEKNIERMASKARHSGVRFRPHFKTHQSHAIGRWFREYGVEAITVSSLQMAAYFAADGWEDITVAFPVNLREIRTINQLAEKIRLHLLVDQPESVQALQAELTHPVQLWMKIDVGYGRAGIPWGEEERIVALARQIRAHKRTQFAGILTHAGHSYDAANRDALAGLFRETAERMQHAREALQQAGIDAVQISVGDTPTCAVVSDFSGVDEVRPGNFVFFDAMQWRRGVCSEEEIAMVVACPVVARYPERRQVLLYGGAVHLSKESLPAPDGGRIYGYLAPLHNHGWGLHFPEAGLVSLSQEHGKVRASAEWIAQRRVGELLAVIPVHSCLTANLLKRYITLNGNWLEMARI